MVSAEPLDEFLFVNFRGAGRAGGLDLTGDTGDDSVDLSSVGDSVCKISSSSGSMSHETP